MAKTLPTAEAYVSARAERVRTTLEELRKLVKSTLPGVTEGMKWGAPVCSEPEGCPVVYLYGGKDHANLGFLRGTELDDPDELLEGTGVSGRHVKIYPGDEDPRSDPRSPATER